jgi:hypothetical protein
MKRMRRWMLLFVALTALVVRVESLKGTALILAGKNSKATTTTAATSTSTEEPAKEQEEPAEEEAKAENTAESKLTGIPQIDYRLDPNLPRELNGHNLSNYPFLDSVPAEEDIGFTCDESKKGFYASTKFGCQLYHHCLYGYRSDFICPNYTSFDQKTFICHFVNKVDCKNSEKYWNRNDDLYIPTTARSTTSILTELPLPTPNPDIYKRPPPGGMAGRRRPQKPRRPPAEYYYDEDEYDEDDYDDRGRRRPQRPRNRRPEYVDDDDYDSRRAYDRNRNRDRLNRRPAYKEDYEDDYEYDRPRQPERSRNRNRNTSRRNNYGNEERRAMDDRRSERRRPNGRPYGDERRPYGEDRKPQDDDMKSYSDDRRSIDDDRRPLVNDRINEPEEKRPIERRPIRPKNRNRDKVEDDEDINERKYEPVSDSKFVKPTGSGSSVYDRPRVAPKIARPVPLNEKTKYAYKTTEKPKSAPVQNEYEEYEEEEEELPPPPPPLPTRNRKGNRGAQSDTRRESNFRGYNERDEQVKAKPISPAVDAVDYEYYDDVEGSKANPAPPSVKKNRETNSRPNASNRNNNRNYDDSEDRLSRYKSNSERYKPRLNKDIPVQTTTKAPEPTIMKNIQQPSGFQQKKYANKQTVFEPTTASTEALLLKTTESSVDYDYDKMRVRVFKRPFLPSRGGNPYKARGLQPVGSVAATQSPKAVESERQIEDERNFSAKSEKPKNYYNYQTDDGSRTTLEDIYNEDFDVNLNDALDPTIRPLPLSSSRINDYSTYDDRNYYSSSYRKSDEIILDEQRSSPSEYRSSKIPSVKPQFRVSTTTTTTPAPDSQYEYEEYEEY